MRINRTKALASRILLAGLFFTFLSLSVNAQCVNPTYIILDQAVGNGNYAQGAEVRIVNGSVNVLCCNIDAVFDVTITTNSGTCNVSQTVGSQNFGAQATCTPPDPDFGDPAFSQSVGQSFLACADGAITNISFPIKQVSGGPCGLWDGSSFILSISNGTNVLAPVYSETVTATVGPNSYTLATPFPVVSGNEYTFMVALPNPCPDFSTGCDLEVFTTAPCASTTVGYGTPSVPISATSTGGTGGITYTWNPGNLVGQTVNVSPAVSTVYTVTATDANGCTDNATMDVLVTDVTTCHPNGKKIMVCHVPPGNPGNAHEICISSNAVPAHLAGGIGHSGCRVGPCMDPCDALKAGSALIGLNPGGNTSGNSISASLFPNPTNGNFVLSLGDLGSVTYEIQSIDGRSVLRGVTEGNLVRLDLSGQKSGLYIVSVRSPEGNWTERLIKE